MDLQTFHLILQTWDVDAGRVSTDASGRLTNTNTPKGKAFLDLAYNNYLLEGDWHLGETGAVSGISNSRLSPTGKGVLAALNRASAKVAPESFPAVFKKSFQSDADYAEFAMSKAAPRYSATLADAGDIGDMLGLKEGEALFSNNMDVLKRVAINWDANGFEAFVDLAENYPEYPDAEDSWWVRANSSVPSWFIGECSSTGLEWPALDAPIAEVEAVMLDMLIGENHEILSFLDRDDNLEWILSLIALDCDCQPRKFDAITEG